MAVTLAAVALVASGVTLDALTYVSRCLDLVECEVAEPEPTTTSAPPLTAAPTATAAPAPTPVPSGTGVGRWRDLVAAYFPASEVDMALCTMAGESGGDPNAYNESTAAGLMQVHWLSWGDHYGVSVEDLFDPETNIRIAADIWRNGGWGHWSAAC